MDSEKLKEYQEILAKDTSKVPEFWINKYKNEAAKNW
jgi:methyltransferase-like protein 6